MSWSSCNVERLANKRLIPSFHVFIFFFKHTFIRYQVKVRYEREKDTTVRRRGLTSDYKRFPLPLNILSAFFREYLDVRLLFSLPWSLSLPSRNGLLDIFKGQQREVPRETSYNSVSNLPSLPFPRQSRGIFFHLLVTAWRRKRP